MSDVQTPPAPQPEPAPAPRQCPRCGAPMTEEQEWCLACGAAVGTHVVAAPGWRAPLILAAVLATVAVIAIAIAIVQLADDTDEVQQPPATAQATPTPPPATTPAPTPDPTLADPNATPTPGATTTPEATTTPDPTTTPEATATPGSGSSDVGDWPAGTSGWTVVLASTTSESSADDKAEAFIADGISGVGVLRSDDYSSLKAGYWVVFSGQYDTQAEARDALDGIDASDAYVRRIAPN